MDEQRKRAYRHLLYWAMLAIRPLGWYRFRTPLGWWSERKRIKCAGVIADWLHNLALYSSLDFEGFNEEWFWRDYEHARSRCPDFGLESYRERFDQVTAEMHPNTYLGLGWSIEIAEGWKAEEQIVTSGAESRCLVAIAPASQDAALTITGSPEDLRGTPAKDWVEIVGKSNRDRGRIVSAVKRGDFVGYASAFSTTTEDIRGWVLCAGSQPLDVTYRCGLELDSRDDLIVEEMLKTLRRR